MANTSESCSTTSSNLPVVVRVKRKASHSPLEAFWLEINERPSKRALLDFAKLSISETSSQKEELKNKKVFVQHVETVIRSDATLDILQSFVVPNLSESRTKVEERKQYFKEGNKQDHLLSRSKQKHECMAKNARFEQIWKSRKGKKETTDEGLHEICHLYDVVRVDSEDDHSNKKEKAKDTSLEESIILSEYLPLLEEFLPSVAEEIQSDIQSYISQQGSADDYVYDLYTVQDELKASGEVHLNAYPLVQVDEDDDFHDGPLQSEFESDDSNAEDNPLNDYPDEETSEDEDDEDKSRISSDENEDEDEEAESTSSDNQSDKCQDQQYDLEDELYEEFGMDDDYDEDEEDDWR